MEYRTSTAGGWKDGGAWDNGMYIMGSIVPTQELVGRMVMQGIHIRVHYEEYCTGMAVEWKDGGAGEMWSRT